MLATNYCIIQLSGKVHSNAHFTSVIKSSPQVESLSAHKVFHYAVTKLGWKVNPSLGTMQNFPGSSAAAINIYERMHDCPKSLT